MKRKILILTNQFGQGGVERSLLEAFNVIDPSKYDVTLFLRYKNTELLHLVPDYVKVVINEEGHYRRQPRAIVLALLVRLFSFFNQKQKAEKYQVRYEEFLHEKKIQNPYRKYFKNSDFDVVISYTIHTCTEMALEIPAKKHYVFFHSGDGDFHRDITEKTFGKYDGIIAVGKMVKDVLEEAFPQYKKKIVLIENFTDASRIIKKAEEPINKVREEKIYLCTVARVDKEKGIDLAIEAAKLLKQQGLLFEWIIIGDGSDRDKIEKLIEKYELEENIVLLGFLENPFPYVSFCDIYVQPSYEESYGLSIFEALVLGKAIVSTDTLGATEVLDDGKYGKLVAIDAKSIANGIIELVNNPEKKSSFEKSYNGLNNANRDLYKEKWQRILDGETV